MITWHTVALQKPDFFKSFTEGPTSPEKPGVSITEHSGFQTRATLPYFDGVGNPSLTGDLVLISSYLQDGQRPSHVLAHLELQNEDGNVHSEVFRPGNGEILNDRYAWAEQDLLDGIPVIGSARQNPLSIGENAQGEGSLPQSFADDNSNGTGSLHHPSMGSSSLSTWSPQQPLVTPTAQNFMSFHSPSLMLSQPIVHHTSLLQPQMMQQQQALSNANSISPSFYPPQALSIPFLPGPTSTTRTPCPFCIESFARPSDLNRHWKSVHLGIKYHCNYLLGCPNNSGKGYCRLEKLRTHQREKHGFAWS